jgi:hypothetical protein
VTITDEKLLVGADNAKTGGMMKLSMGKKKHVLLQAR